MSVSHTRPDPDDPPLRLSLRHLRLVDAIDRAGSLAGAAGLLNMTQSAVTKALQDAEGAAGAALFARTARGSVATPCGALVVRHAREILGQMRRAGRELAELRGGLGGTVAVGTLPSAAGGLVPDAIGRLLEARPGLRVTITEGPHDRLTDLLRQGDLDFVVGRLPARRLADDLSAQILADDRALLVVRASHPLAALPEGDPGLRLAALQGQPWMLPPPDTTMRRQLDAAFRDAGLPPPVPRVESLSFLSNRSLLLGWDFLTIWPQQLAMAEAQRGQVAILPVALPGIERPLGLWWRTASPMSPAAQAMEEALASAAAALPAAPLSRGPAG